MTLVGVRSSVSPSFPRRRESSELPTCTRSVRFIGAAAPPSFPRRRESGFPSRVRARVFAAFGRILLHCVDSCRRREGENCRLGIVELQIVDCMVSPWATVWFEWPWVYGSTWVLFCQIRCRGDSRLRGNDGGAAAGMTWEVVGMTWEVVGMTWEGAGIVWEVVGMTWEVVGMTWEAVCGNDVGVRGNDVGGCGNDGGGGLWE